MNHIIIIVVSSHSHLPRPLIRSSPHSIQHTAFFLIIKSKRSAHHIIEHRMHAHEVRTCRGNDRYTSQTAQSQAESQAPALKRPASSVPAQPMCVSRATSLRWFHRGGARQTVPRRSRTRKEQQTERDRMLMLPTNSQMASTMARQWWLVADASHMPAQVPTGVCAPARVGDDTNKPRPCETVRTAMAMAGSTCPLPLPFMLVHAEASSCPVLTFSI
jgi:hypothetical protein